MCAETNRLDARRLRGLLAEHQITQRKFAEACSLHEGFVSHVLRGGRAGELARIKLARGLAQFGLDREMEAARHA